MVSCSEEYLEEDINILYLNFKYYTKNENEGEEDNITNNIVNINCNNLSWWIENYHNKTLYIVPDDFSKIIRTENNI